jgi:peptidoglycan L-alanyl-D-glutamate endopeptidase CwlK
MPLNERSKQKLVGVHPDLIRVVEEAYDIAKEEGFDFIITEGVRSLKRQRELVAAGASQTMKSRHIPGPDGLAKAIDFAVVIAGEITWKFPAYTPIAACFKQAAAKLGIPIVWGGDWKSLRDGPHIELDRKKYP